MPGQLRRTSAMGAAAPAAPLAAPPPPAVPTPLASELRKSLLAQGGKDVLDSAEPVLKVVEHLERRAHKCTETLAKVKPQAGAGAPSASTPPLPGSSAVLSTAEAKASKAQAALKALRARVGGFEGALTQLERTHAAVLNPAVALLREDRPDPDLVRRLCMMPLLPEEMSKLASSIRELENEVRLAMPCLACMCAACACAQPIYATLAPPVPCPSPCPHVCCAWPRLACCRRPVVASDEKPDDESEAAGGDPCR